MQKDEADRLAQAIEQRASRMYGFREAAIYPTLTESWGIRVEWSTGNIYLVSVREAIRHIEHYDKFAK